jgi:hypothetical protein
MSILIKIIKLKQREIIINKKDEQEEKSYIIKTKRSFETKMVKKSRYF